MITLFLGDIFIKFVQRNKIHRIYASISSRSVAVMFKGRRGMSKRDKERERVSSAFLFYWYPLQNGLYLPTFELQFNFYFFVSSLRSY
jgi:hypothetical protein